MIQHLQLTGEHLILEDARRKDCQNTLFVTAAFDTDAVRVLCILTVPDAEQLRDALHKWLEEEKGSKEANGWRQYPKEKPEPLKAYMVEIHRVIGPYMPIYRGIGSLGDNGRFQIEGLPKEATEKWDDTCDSVYFKEWK